ncbi:MAG: DUF2924 domain-containing protein [Planctomycetota bacterium]
MTVKELRAKFADVCGDETRSGNRAWLIRRIAWRLQANHEGGLTERARQRARELACVLTCSCSHCHLLWRYWPRLRSGQTACCPIPSAELLVQRGYLPHGRGLPRCGRLCCCNPAAVAAPFLLQNRGDFSCFWATATLESWPGEAHV